MNNYFKKVAITFVSISLSSHFAQAAEKPIPPDGEPLPTERSASDSFSCKNGGDIKIEDIPMSVSQACAKEYIYRVLPRGNTNICGRKGRKQWRACMEKKLGGICIEMSNLKERRVPTNYCPGWKP